MLIRKDQLLFVMAQTELVETENERKLHEVCINHRLALYLESNLEDIDKSDYSVDIEYNRNFDLVKRARRTPEEEEIIVRPDIIIHKRANNNLEIANYLVIEAKKGESSAEDKDKIERLLLDARFKFKYGLTISYLRNPDSIDCIIYYLENTQIQTRQFSVSKAVNN